MISLRVIANVTVSCDGKTYRRGEVITRDTMEGMEHLLADKLCEVVGEPSVKELVSASAPDEVSNEAALDGKKLPKMATRFEMMAALKAAGIKYHVSWTNAKLRELYNGLL